MIVIFYRIIELLSPSSHHKIQIDLCRGISYPNHIKEQSSQYVHIAAHYNLFLHMEVSTYGVSRVPLSEQRRSHIL